MAIYMLSDPHLSLTADKPMDIFGARWENYIEKLKNNWNETVSEDDTVVIPGDISWGMGFDTAAEDLTFIHNLPGRKIIGKGNHDYWWATQPLQGGAWRGFHRLSVQQCVSLRGFHHCGDAGVDAGGELFRRGPEDCEP